jgi:hypothetical protein
MLMTLVLFISFHLLDCFHQKLQQNLAVDRKHQVIGRVVGPLVLFQRGLPNSTLPIEFTRRAVDCFARGAGYAIATGPAKKLQQMFCIGLL